MFLLMSPTRHLSRVFWRAFLFLSKLLMYCLRADENRFSIIHHVLCKKQLQWTQYNSHANVSYLQVEKNSSTTSTKRSLAFIFDLFNSISTSLVPYSLKNVGHNSNLDDSNK